MKEELVRLANELERIDEFMLLAERDFNYLLEKVHPSNRKSAVNLLHYLALRSLDIRNLQDAHFLQKGRLLYSEKGKPNPFPGSWSLLIRNLQMIIQKLKT